MSQKLGFLVTEPVQVGDKNYIDTGTHKILINPKQQFRAISKKE